LDRSLNCALFDPAEFDSHKVMTDQFWKAFRPCDCFFELL